MLASRIKKAITSIGEAELQSLYEKFVKENGTESVQQFILQLYKNNSITSDELKRIESQEKILITGTDRFKAKKKIEPGKETVDLDLYGDHYQVLESIDEGAMGKILLAKDNELGRVVAFKQIHKPLVKMPGFMDRFMMEAQVTAQLQHPNIVPIYQLKEINGEIGYAMKLIYGKTLKDLVLEAHDQLESNKRVDDEHSLRALLDHFLKVCDAIHYAHRKGVIHRDLKPVNIMVGPFNEVYVMDWGIAKLIDVDEETFADQTERVSPYQEELREEQTRVGEVLGTPVYMSPEQASGKNDSLDHRSDLFTLGLILYELVTLQRAYGSDNQYDVMSKAVQARLNPPTPYSPKMNVPKQLLAIINKATQLNPDDRYQTVHEFADDIRRYMHGASIKAKPDSIGQKIMRLMVRHRLATLNIMAWMLLTSVVLVGWTFYQQKEAEMVAQIEGQKISEIITTVTNKTQTIDAQFLKFEAILEGIASGAISLIKEGRPDTGPIYTNIEYNNPTTAPPDYEYSEIYKIPISVDWPVFKLAPGVKLSDVEQLIRTINPLRHTFKRLILKSHPASIDPGQGGAHNIIMNTGLPITWAYVGLKEGFIIDYPGKTGYPDEYDPRKRPWYVQTLQTKTTGWVKPYIDVSGRGWMLPCTTPLYDIGGEFLGVAVVEMTLEFIRNNYLQISNVPAIEKTFLINEEGRIVVSSADNKETYKTGTLINKIRDLPLYSLPKVVTAIKNQESGNFRYDDNGTEKIIAYYRLNSIGWYYLAEVDASQIMH